MKAFRGFCLGLVIATVAVLVWTDARLQRYEQEAKDAGARADIARANYAESLLFVKRDTIRVTRWATRYDTLRVEGAVVLETASSDSVTLSRDWLRGLLVASDSTVAACRDLGSTRGALTACDSVQAALRSELGITKSLYAAEKRRSKLRRALPWIAGAAGFWAGAKLRVP